MMHTLFNDRLRQILLLILIIFIGLLMFIELKSFLPGFLGGITLFILTRELFDRLVYNRKWKKGLTALLFILGCLVIISIPIYLAVKMVSPKINYIIHNETEIIAGITGFITNLEHQTGFELLSDDNIKSLTQKVSQVIPSLINSTASLLANLLMMFFLLYYLLVNGREIISYLKKVIPLKPDNIMKLGEETQLLIRANALGIPVICVVQGLTASLGYWIFGVNDWGMWGFLTGVFAFFPLVGTMIIWVPIVIALFMSGATWQATALTLYSFIVTGNVDYLTRLGLLKKIGNVHPLITIMGVIAGLNLFGFMGLIFGPLLLSYFIILLKIYMNEFVVQDTVETTDTIDSGINK